MARDKNRTPDYEDGTPSNRDLKSSKSRTGHKSESETSYDTKSDHENGLKRSEGRKKGKRKRSRSSRKKSRHDYDEDSYSSDSEDSYSDSDSYSSESTEERRRERKRKDGREKESEKERKRRREKEKERRRRRRKEKERDEKKKKEKRKKKKKDKKNKGKTGAVTDSWGKYGIIRESDMWTKRPEFTAWLAEVKQVNLESLPNWEEKQLFKEFMEDHNTATFPSKKYYNLAAYDQRQMEKEMKKGLDKVLDTERIVFDDEEQRRQELLVLRERQKEEQLQTLKHSMRDGMAQAMKEQALLKEEMAYQYKLGNFEAAAAIQRRLDPDVAM